ncbi:MAG: GNAT family N-acetyltransferase [Legionellales bacterium]|nr:GNAT family N-acetyltransferase [Legionellales bacterium]
MTSPIQIIDLTHRKATIHDLQALVHLLIEDELGKTREQINESLDQRYFDAFHRIDADPNQYLMVVCQVDDIIGTCHLTIMPSLTYTGSTRMQIEAVRVSTKHRGQKIGEWMMQAAFEFAKSHQVAMIQLTTNKQRSRAKQFYERLGFKASHEGMKLHIHEKGTSF